MNFDQLSSYDELLSGFRDMISAASKEILLGAPPEFLSELRPALQEAHERGVFVVVCIYTPTETAADVRFDDIATLAHAWDVENNVMVHADQSRGIVAQHGMARHSDGDSVALRYDTYLLYELAFTQFMVQEWSMSEEVYVSDPPTLPVDCGGLRDAAVNATLHFLEDNQVGFEAEVRPAPADPDDPWGSTEGQLTTTRQNFIEPNTNTFFGEVGLIGHVEGEGRVTMGGVGAYAEDYETRNIRLEPVG